MLKISPKAQAQLLLKDTHNIQTPVCLKTRWCLLFSKEQLDVTLSYLASEQSYLVKLDGCKVAQGNMHHVFAYLDGLEQGLLTTASY